MNGIPCLWMRGGTSKGAYFAAADLPDDREERNDLLLRIMGSPDPRQIDGIGGGHPLTSKVAVVSASSHADADVDYLFLQVSVDEALVSDSQNCGNLLAGVGPFAVERALVQPDSDRSQVRIRMVNSGSLATASFLTPGGVVRYDGETTIAGVPGSAAPISLAFSDTAGSTCGALLPTGQIVDDVNGIEVTCIDNGMPTVIVAATDLGVAGDESPETLEDDDDLTRRLAQIRLHAGKMMNLGDVSEKTVPKMTLVSEAQGDATINTRTFIPTRCHTAIGVLGAITVGTAARIPGSVAHRRTRKGDHDIVRIAHPTGYFDVEVDVRQENSTGFSVERAAAIRTARKLFDGHVYPAQ